MRVEPKAANLVEKMVVRRVESKVEKMADR